MSEGRIIRDRHSGLPSGRAWLKLRLGLWEAAMTLSAAGTHLGELFGVAGTEEWITFRATVRTRWTEGLLAELECRCHREPDAAP